MRIMTPRMLYFLLPLFFLLLGMKPPELTPEIVLKKSREIMRQHASQKDLNPLVMRRIFQSFLDELDPTKTYFTVPDIEKWLDPQDKALEAAIEAFRKGDFSTFFAMQDALGKAITRRRSIEPSLEGMPLPDHVSPQAFRDSPWAKNEKELIEKILAYRALQLDAINNLSPELKEKTLQRIDKREAKTEEEMTSPDMKFRKNLVYAELLKAVALSLDSQTNYFTPEEASQFLINFQQRLQGIGVLLRDDINGFTVTKIVEGGPSSRGKELRAKDRIIAVNGEPVVGMDISDVVSMIRGPENTPVVLTVVRKAADGKGEEKLDVTVNRGEVVLNEARYKATLFPFGKGVIAVLRLHSFYQDPETSSTKDLTRALNQIKKEHPIEGVILDLRNNTGGLLNQAVAVTGLFITKGVVVSIKDETGEVQKLRNLEGPPLWSGPLIVLIDRTSASASEIVAQTLQDYGRALIVGDDHSFGKGSFQTFTLDSTAKGGVNPEGEYKVTRGRYYTVSGKSPQLVGVASEIVVPGSLSESDIGEKFSKYPLESDHIEESFNDDLSDIPFIHRLKFEALYKSNLQRRSKAYQKWIPTLKRNSAERLSKNGNYQNFLTELKKKTFPDTAEMAPFGMNDLQLEEGVDIMKDLLILNHQDDFSKAKEQPLLKSN